MSERDIFGKSGTPAFNIDAPPSINILVAVSPFKSISLESIEIGGFIPNSSLNYAQKYSISGSSNDVMAIYDGNGYQYDLSTLNLKVNNYDKIKHIKNVFDNCGYITTDVEQFSCEYYFSKIPLYPYLYKNYNNLNTTSTSGNLMNPIFKNTGNSISFI